MTDFLNMGEEKRSLLVMKNFSWFIYVNSDTVYRHIREFEISIRSKAEEKAQLVGALSVFLSVLLSVLTAENFHDFLKVPSSVWQAALYILLVFSGALGVWKAFKLLRNRHEEKAEDVLERIAGGREKLEDALRTHVLREF